MAEQEGQAYEHNLKFDTLNPNTAAGIFDGLGLVVKDVTAMTERNGSKFINAIELLNNINATLEQIIILMEGKKIYLETKNQMLMN